MKSSVQQWECEKPVIYYVQLSHCCIFHQIALFTTVLGNMNMPKTRMTIVSRPIKKNKLDKGSQKTSQIFILKDITWDIISFWKRTNGIFMLREQTNKQNLCVKEISLYINQYSQKRYDRRLYRAENSTQQKKIRNDREGANDMNYMKT